MNNRVFGTLFLALCLTIGSASASSIAIFTSVDGTACGATVPPFTAFTLWIQAPLYADIARDGITGAEFQVLNWPVGWFGSSTPNPAVTTAIGDPIRGGCNITFDACQSGPLVLLYTVNGLATSSVQQLYLEVSRHSNPSSPAFLCPWLAVCDAPVFTKICVPGGSVIINGGFCPVGIQPATWSQVKAVYRD